MKQSVRLGLANVTIRDVIEEIIEEREPHQESVEVLRECRIAYNALRTAILILDPEAYKTPTPLL